MRHDLRSVRKGKTMEESAIKIPVLIFFLAAIYFALTGFKLVDAIVRAFLTGFSTVPIILILTLLFMFFLTLCESRSESVKTPGVKDAGKKVEMQA